MKPLNKSNLINFEKKISNHWEEGNLPFLIHLSGGNEDFLINFFNKNIRPGDWIFSSHRNHYHALLSGIPEDKLEDLILAGKSMFIYDRNNNFFTSSLLAGTCCIAVGVALSLKLENSSNKVWCFLGDGAEDEGHFYESVLMAEGHDLPCTFIIEDNNRSVDTKLSQRLPNEYRVNWPVKVIRDKYISTYPHAGNGTKKIIQFKNNLLKGEK